MTATEPETGGTGKENRLGHAAARRKDLVAAGLGEPAASSLVDMFDEIRESFLTKQEADARFDALRREQGTEHSRERAETSSEFAEVRGEMRTGFAEVRREMAEQGSELRELIAKQGNELRELIAKQGSELRGEIAELRVGMGKLRNDLTWRMILIVGSMLAAAVALDRLFT